MADCPEVRRRRDGAWRGYWTESRREGTKRGGLEGQEEGVSFSLGGKQDRKQAGRGGETLELLRSGNQYQTLAQKTLDKLFC